MPPVPLRLRKAHVAKSGIPNTPDPQPVSKASPADGVPPAPFFPLARYASVTAVHACLLGFTALYLPRSSLSSFTSLAPPGSSAHAAEPGNETPPDALHLLTSHPARTVAWLCAGAALLQPWWAAWVASWAREAGDRDAAQVSQRKLLSRQRAAALQHAALATFAASLALYAAIVLFGAPLASHALPTYALALLLALLTAWTPAYILGAPTPGSGTEALVIRLAWIRLFAERRPRTPVERAMVYPALGAAFGCWSGAIPIGLDWERPWQAWPLTPAYGAIAGYVVGLFAAFVISTVLWLAETDILSRPLAAAKQPRGRHR